MNQMTMWIEQAIRTTAGFILWVILAALAAGLVFVIAVVVFAVIKAAVESVWTCIKAAVDVVRNGGKKDE